MPPQTIVKVAYQIKPSVCLIALTWSTASACVSKVSSVQGKAIAMIEGSANGDMPLPVQQAWLDRDVLQSGFCQPGRIRSAR